MHKKRKKQKHIFLVIMGVVIIVMAIFSYTLKKDRELNPVEAFFKDAVTSIEKIVFYPFKKIVSSYNDYKELKDIRNKYQELLPEVERIDSLNAENIELRKQLEAMKDELNIKYTVNDYEYLNATIIFRDVTHWYNTITIDKGKFNGIEKDMIVVNNKGLVGKITNVTTFTSDVRLITDSDTNNKISVRISDGKNSLNGLIRGYNHKTNYLEVEGISNTERVSNGYYVYTSGLGGVYPSGILVGVVDNVGTDEYDLAKIIYVKPAIDFDDINYVAVLKRKEIDK